MRPFEESGLMLLYRTFCIAPLPYLVSETTMNNVPYHQWWPVPVLNYLYLCSISPLLPIQLTMHMWGAYEGKKHQSHFPWCHQTCHPFQEDLKCSVVWLNLLNNFTYLQFISVPQLLPKKVSVEMVSWFHTEGSRVTVHRPFSKLLIILQAVGPRACSKDSIRHIGCACYFFLLSHCTSSH